MNDVDNMPCPRLELEWVMVGPSWRERECIYSLVIPLGEHDIRREDGNNINNVIKSELGRTRVIGGRGNPPINIDGIIDTPFRDYAHSQFDCDALGGHIPIVSVCGEKFTVLEP